jgi:hypothetical protein
VNSAGKPVSRILFPRRTGGDDHSSSPAIAGGIQRPTRELTAARPLMRPRRSLAERATPPLLFGLAPCGVCPALDITIEAVRSYRTFSPLLGHLPQRTATKKTGRYIFCGTFRVEGELLRRSPPALAVSEHTALRSSDFPLPRPCEPA